MARFSLGSYTIASQYRNSVGTSTLCINVRKLPGQPTIVSFEGGFTHNMDQAEAWEHGDVVVGGCMRALT